MSDRLLSFLPGGWFWIAATVILFGGGCDEPGASSMTGRLVVTGSSTVAPLAVEIARRFEARHPGVKVDVQTGGSSRGIADTRRGLADIGMVSRDLKPGERDLIAYPLARDGIAVIVHADNPVTALSHDQIVAVYRGEIDNWRQVGGPDRPITVVNKAHGRSTLELFVAYFGLDEGAIAADVVIGDNEQGIKTVAGNPGAIGYVSIGTAEFDIAHGVSIKMLPLEGIAADSAAVAGGRYPLSRTLNLVTRREPGALAREFIAFSRSKAVQDLVHQQSFVSLVE